MPNERIPPQQSTFSARCVLYTCRLCYRQIDSNRHGPLRVLQNMLQTRNTLLPRVFLDGHDEWKFIIGTNLKVCTVLLTGVLSLGFMSMANLAWIGLSTGWVVRSAMVSGVSWERVAALTLPHGLLELAGFAMIAAVGCEGFIIVYRKLRFNKWSFSMDRMSLNFRRLTAGLLLVLAASMVETYITGQIAARFN